MATKLEKDITRVSTVKYDDREIMVTITADQKISMKLKGMRSGEVNITIEELYKQLVGVDSTSNTKESGSIVIKHNQPKKGSANNPMISLYDLRSYNAISGLDMPTLVKFEGIIKNLIDDYPEKYGKYSKNDALK